jgi:putative inorganic carbon (HCO3(-)) transporter
MTNPLLQRSNRNAVHFSKDIAFSIKMCKLTVTSVSDSFLCEVRTLPHRMGDMISGAEIFLLVVIYVAFIFSDSVPLPGLVAMSLLWIARWWTTGRLTAATPMDMSILHILAMVPVSLYVSLNRSLSLPKLYGLILGVAVFYAVVNATRIVRRVQIAVIALILLSAAVIMLGLVGTDWRPGIKFFSWPQLYGHLPKLIQGIPRSLRGGFSPPGIGGTLIFLIPVLLSLLWSSRSATRIKKANDNRLLQIWWASYQPILVLTLLFTIFTLILTQSRASFIGISVGLLALATWYDSRALLAIALALFALLKSGRGAQLTQFLLRANPVSVQWRTEIWQQAIHMIRDFPHTGVGMGAFDTAVNTMYPFSIIPAGVRVTHAHNELLQVTVDLGIPGLVGYVALLTTFAITAWRAYHALDDRWLRALIVGLACGMLAHQVFGLTDAFLLGTKPGVVMWVFMGLIAALYVHRDSMAGELSGNEGAKVREEGNGLESISGNSEASGGWLSGWLGTFLLAFGCWGLFSLVAIAFVGDWPYLGLAIALAGGVVLGFVCMRRFESVTAQPCPDEAWERIVGR